MCCMPNTRPVNDQRAVTELIVRRAREAGAVRVRPIGAITHGLEGKALADIAEMKEAGIVAISDDGRPVMNAGLMRRAFEYAKTFDLPLVQHAEELGYDSLAILELASHVQRDFCVVMPDDARQQVRGAHAGAQADGGSKMLTKAARCAVGIAMQHGGEQS